MSGKELKEKFSDQKSLLADSTPDKKYQPATTTAPITAPIVKAPNNDISSPSSLNDDSSILQIVLIVFVAVN